MTNQQARPIGRGDVKARLEVVADMTGYKLTPESTEITLDSIKGRLTGKEALSALGMLLESGKKPTIANLLAFEKGGFDDVETAYAKAVANLTDETATTLTNDCILRAWSIAAPLYDQGMHFDASRAFKSAYEQAVQSERENGVVKPKWQLSPGTDKQQREDFIRDSAANGMIPIEYARQQLPHLTIDEITNPTLAIENKGFTPLIENLADEKLTDDERKANKEAMKGVLQLLSKQKGEVA